MSRAAGNFDETVQVLHAIVRLPETLREYINNGVTWRHQTCKHHHMEWKHEIAKS